jgi:hypothetical protein
VGRLCRAHQLRRKRNACYKDAFSSAFRRPILRCVGPQHGDACPRNFNVDVTCARTYVTLGELQLDHEQDLVVTCDMWVQALAALPRAPAHVGRRRRRHAAVPPALLGARRPGGRGGDAALPLRPRAYPLGRWAVASWFGPRADVARCAPLRSGHGSTSEVYRRKEVAMLYAHGRIPIDIRFKILDIHARTGDVTARASAARPCAHNRLKLASSKFRISGVRSLAAADGARMRARPPRRPQLESSAPEPGPAHKVPHALPPHALAHALSPQPLSAIATLLTPYSRPPHTTTDHTALSSPSKRQKSLNMRSLVVPI